MKAFPLLLLATALAVAACGRSSQVAFVPSPPEPPRAAQHDEFAGGKATATPPPAQTTTSSIAPITDALITTRVRASLVRDPALAGADISVNTDRGVVNLTGSVLSQEQAAIASSHAQRQDGVMRIDSHLALNVR